MTTARTAQTGEQIEGGAPGIPGGPMPEASAPYLDMKPALQSPSRKMDNTPKELNEYIQAGQKELEALQMQNHEARVCLILDISSSMQSQNQFFSRDVIDSKGKTTRIHQIQSLINKAVAMGFLIDDNKSIELIPFGGQAYPPITITSKNFMHAVDLVFDTVNFIDAEAKRNPDYEDYNKENAHTPRTKKMWNALKNKTNYAAAVREVRKHFFKNDKPCKIKQPCNDLPVFAIFITDGDTDERDAALKEFNSSTYQAIFWKIIALKGQQKASAFKTLQDIDDAKTGYIDNADSVILNNVDELTMNQLFNEYRGWLRAAYNERVLLTDPRIKFDKIIGLDQEGRSEVAAGCHNEFDHLKEEIMECFEDYISSWKLSLFGHHHNDRAIAVKNAIANCKDLEILLKIIVNQEAILRGDVKDNLSEKILSKRWSDVKQMTQRKTKAELQSSGYYRAVCQAKKLFDDYFVQNDDYKKTVGLHKH